jgi:hypothetical protein
LGKITKLIITILLLLITLVLVKLYYNNKKCLFSPNVFATRIPFDVTIINNQNDLNLLQIQNILDKEYAKIGAIVIQTHSFAYILNPNDLWQYTFTIYKQQTPKTPNNFFTKDALAIRKTLPMYQIKNNDNVNNIKTSCTHIYNHENAQINSLISYNNNDYTNLIPNPINYKVEKIGLLHSFFYQLSWLLNKN